MGRFGRSKEYLNQVDVPVGEFIFKKAEQHLILDAAQKNYFLHYIFTKRFYPQLPHYLREENFETIKSQLHKIKLVHGTAQEALEQYENLDFCNFSNIFEGRRCRTVEPGHHDYCVYAPSVDNDPIR